MPQFIRILNFEKFQHYRDRKPPWIKLYRDLLSDDRLFDLSEADRYQLIALFILASQHDNLIPNKQEWLRKELAVKRPIPLQKLIDTGWIEVVEQDASKVLHVSTPLADCEQDAIPRARAESRVEKSREETETYIPHGEFGCCRLSPEQFGKLQIRLTSQLPAYIARFDRWVHESPKAKTSGVMRENRHAYESILNWADKDGHSNGNSKLRETEHEKNNRAVKEFLDRSMAPEVRRDLPDVWEESERLP